LLLLGSTRTKGDRRRTVKKVAEYLQNYRENTFAALALDALESAGSDTGLQLLHAEWMPLTQDGPEGAMLAELLRSAS
ncbi:MAG: hypothetical protein ABI852_12710, partial [Gemmatimonadaceae bacterium]